MPLPRPGESRRGHQHPRHGQEGHAEQRESLDQDVAKDHRGALRERAVAAGYVRAHEPAEVRAEQDARGPHAGVREAHGGQQQWHVESDAAGGERHADEHQAGVGDRASAGHRVEANGSGKWSGPRSVAASRPGGMMALAGTWRLALDFTVQRRPQHQPRSTLPARSRWTTSSATSRRGSLGCRTPTTDQSLRDVRSSSGSIAGHRVPDRAWPTRRGCAPLLA